MPNRYTGKARLPFLSDFSTRERLAAERAISTQEARRRKASDSRGRQAEQVVETVQRRLRYLLGARNYARLREDIQRERLAFSDFFQPPQGLKRHHATQKIASRRRVDALLRKLGARGPKVRKVISAANAKLEALLIPDDRKLVVPGYHLKNNLSKWTKLSPLHKFPLPWGVRPGPGGVLGDLPELEQDPNDPHRWFLFQPPFFGFLFSDDIVTTGDFRADRLLHLHPPSGLVGNECTMDLDDAGDWNVAHVIGEAQIAFAFTPPEAGIIEVLIDAQPTIATHRIAIEDEFGFSDAWCYQNNFLMMNVLHPNVPEHSLAQMSSHGAETGGDDVTTGAENLTRGQHYFARLFSSGPVPAGQSVIVTAGTRTFDICYSNDMELHSRSDFRWFINSVEVRIAP
jgi:hypothetical protein